MSLLGKNVAYWKLNQSSGTRIDSNPNRSDLADNNSVTSATGKIGSAAHFDREDDEFLDVVTNSFLEMGDISFTIAGWVRLDSKGSGGSTLTIIGKSQPLVNVFEYATYYETGIDRFVFLVRSDTVFKQVNADNFGSPSTGVFYFIKCEHSTVDDEISISVNNGTPDTLAAT